MRSATLDAFGDAVYFVDLSAVSDPALVPSTAAVKVSPSMEAHPLDRLRRAGVRVSINTDDPSLLGTNLPRE